MSDRDLEAVLLSWPGVQARRVPTTAELLERDAQTARAIRAYLQAGTDVPDRGDTRL